MKNKGRRHKSGRGPYASGNCKGYLCGITRPENSMSSPSNKKYKDGHAIVDPRDYRNSSNKWLQKKWSKRMRGFLKTSKFQELNNN